jgi:hypothetical protein
VPPHIDPTRFPETTRYLATLPKGLDSYPECEVKSSVLREMIEGTDRTLVPQLPDEVRQLVENPPPVNVWVSEAKLNVLLRASIEDLSRRTKDRDAMMDKAFTSTQKLLSGPAYKILFMLLSPERLLVGVDKRWAALRRGTGIERVEDGPRVAGAARLRVHFPDHLYDREILRVRGASLRAAIACAGAKSAAVELEVRDAGTADFVVTWS